MKLSLGLFNKASEVVVDARSPAWKQKMKTSVWTMDVFLMYHEIVKKLCVPRKGGKDLACHRIEFEYHCGLSRQIITGKYSDSAGVFRPTLYVVWNNDHVGLGSSV